MPDQYETAQGIVARKKPAPSSDGQPFGKPFRSGRYGEEVNLSLIPKNHLLADEGSYFFATNPTPGTGILMATVTGVPTIGAATDKNPAFVLVNTATDGTRVYLDSLQLLVTAVNTVTALSFAVQTDIWALRQAATLGTVLTVQNANQDDTNGSVVRLWYGVNTVNPSAGTIAGSTCRLFPNRQLRPVLSVAGDIYAITFGGSEQFVGSLAPAGTAIAQQSFNYPPIVIGGGQCALLYLYPGGASGVGATTLAFDLNWWER